MPVKKVSLSFFQMNIVFCFPPFFVLPSTCTQAGMDSVCANLMTRFRSKCHLRKHASKQGKKIELWSILVYMVYITNLLLYIKSSTNCGESEILLLHFLFWCLKFSQFHHFLLISCFHIKKHICI